MGRLMVLVFPGLAGFLLVFSSVGTAADASVYSFARYFPRQPYLRQIGMPDQMELPDSGPLVAVIDLGMDLGHPALKDKVVTSRFRGRSVIYPETPALTAHGTAVASIIAAETPEMIGVAPHVKILPVMIGLPAPSGYEDLARASLDLKPADLMALAKDPERRRRFVKYGKLRAEILLRNLARGIRYAVDQGAQVISISATTLKERRYVEDAVRYAYQHGVVVIAGSGNDARPEVYYPARFPEVLAVGGVTQDDEWWYQEKTVKGVPIPVPQGSNYGEGLDVVAPCCRILHAYPARLAERPYRSEGCGTSLAVPLVTGLAALIRTLRPELPPGKVYELIRNGSDDLGPPGWDKKFGYGRINVTRTLELLAQSARSGPLPYPR